jgi:hypothetical protein
VSVLLDSFLSLKIISFICFSVNLSVYLSVSLLLVFILSVSVSVLLDSFLSLQIISQIQSTLFLTVSLRERLYFKLGHS